MPLRLELNPHRLLSGKRVLVCEDEGLPAMMIQKALRRAGLEVIECIPDGESALVVAARERPDIVLMDIGLEGLDGLSVGREILQRIDTCLVYLSGHSDQITIEDAIAGGAAGYLVKPIDSQVLLDSLVRFCVSGDSAVVTPLAD